MRGAADRGTERQCSPNILCEFTESRPFALLTTALIVGHIFMAVVNPSTRHALRGMTLGSVDRECARHHHPRWVEEIELTESNADPIPIQSLAPERRPLR
jgi:hypothetical protein